MISFLDYLFYSLGCDKTMKVGAEVISSRRAGATAMFESIKTKKDASKTQKRRV